MAEGKHPLLRTDCRKALQKPPYLGIYFDQALQQERLIFVLSMSLQGQLVLGYGQESSVQESVH